MRAHMAKCKDRPGEYEIETHPCEYCHKNFSTVYNLRTHLTKCKEKKRREFVMKLSKQSEENASMEDSESKAAEEPKAEIKEEPEMIHFCDVTNAVKTESQAEDYLWEAAE